MKKQFLLFALLSASLLSMAQSSVSFGVRGGMSSATLRGDAVNNLNNLLDFTNGAVSTKGNVGIFAGGYASIPVSPLFSVEPGLYYSQKGYELSGELNVKGAEFLGLNAKAKLNTAYADLPVLLKANLNGFQIFAGPQISYLINADLKTTAGVLGFNLLNNSIDATSQFNRWDAGVTGGVGYQFSNGLNITAAYDRGLSKVNSGKNLEGYNQAFKVGLGFHF